MDEVDLRAFLSLAETENTRDTAAILGLGQSNISRALARLEADVCLQLFTRHGRRLKLSAAGAAFRIDAAAILDVHASARRHAAAIASDLDVIRIGFLHSVARWLVPETVAAFREANAQSRISLRQGFGRDIYRWLDDDVIDVALCTPPLRADPSTHWQALAREQLCVAVPRTHRLAGRKRVSIRDLAGEQFVAFSRITELHAVVGALIEESGVDVAVVLESSEIDTMRALVAGGLGVSVIPRPSVEVRDGPIYIPLAPERHRELGVGWRTDRSEAGVTQFVETALQMSRRMAMPERPLGTH